MGNLSLWRCVKALRWNFRKRNRRHRRLRTPAQFRHTPVAAVNMEKHASHFRKVVEHGDQLIERRCRGSLMEHTDMRRSARPSSRRSAGPRSFSVRIRGAGAIASPAMPVSTDAPVFRSGARSCLTTSSHTWMVGKNLWFMRFRFDGIDTSRLAPIERTLEMRRNSSQTTQATPHFRSRYRDAPSFLDFKKLHPIAVPFQTRVAVALREPGIVMVITLSFVICERLLFPSANDN